MRVTRVYRLVPSTPSWRDDHSATERELARDLRCQPQACIVHARRQCDGGGGSSRYLEEIFELGVREEAVCRLCPARVDDDAVRIALTALAFILCCGRRGEDGGIDGGVHDAGGGEALRLCGKERVADEQRVRSVVWGEVEIWENDMLASNQKKRRWN